MKPALKSRCRLVIPDVDKRKEEVHLGHLLLLPSIDHRTCDPVPELQSQFRNRGFETFQDDLSKPVAAFVARLGFRRDLHMSAEPAEPPAGSLWLL
jgi:hypothetical protein